MDQKQNHDDGEMSYTQRFRDVLDAERRYLHLRRQSNHLPNTDQDPDLWGLCFSGGGVRSATFGLGVIQALVDKGLMKRFDYLSTVSGGGYIGSCLSSLLTNRKDTGLDRETSPFNGLREDESYATSEETKLSARHQIHHLRTHGEYLVPRSHLFSRDVQRAAGTVFSGMIYTFLLFTLLFVASVALLLLGLTCLDGDLGVLAPGSGLLDPAADKLGNIDYVKAVLGAWYSKLIKPPVMMMVSGAFKHWATMLWMALAGAAWSLAWLVFATDRVRKLNFSKIPPGEQTRAGWNAEEQWESNFVRAFNISSVIAALTPMFIIAWFISHRVDHRPFPGGLLLPLAFSLGGLVVSHLGSQYASSRFARRSWKQLGQILESRFRRSLYATIRGASLYGTAAALLLPLALILLFSLAQLPLKFFLALAALGWAWFATRGKSQASVSQLGGWLHRPLANIAVALFISLLFAEVSSWILAIQREDIRWSLPLFSLVICAGALLLFVFLGFLIDANRVAPHYFYRDRLTEAYLKTDARTLRSDRKSRQGLPLTVVRDDEDLKLSELGTKNGRGPYHLIVTAMNLTGSDELNRKSFLSEHFIFSRDYLGSRVTGWVKTASYRRDTTRLARAMAISAAAVGSAMGYHTFGAQAFMATLTNARLGYWMENPWRYRHGTKKRPEARFTFWPFYLVLEIFGLTSARTRLVNLSDGGHTGDNLGLLPLLLRRCATIVVSDAEADGKYTFGSFNNAVRMALIEENIEIDIDLSPIMERTRSAAGFRVNKASVVEGRIRYPATTGGGPEFIGRLIYIKSSVSEGDIPVHVANYAKEHRSFPHDTTVDQFFDDAQFEAYRALGERCGKMAAAQVRSGLTSFLGIQGEPTEG